MSEIKDKVWSTVLQHPEIIDKLLANIKQKHDSLEQIEVKDIETNKFIINGELYSLSPVAYIYESGLKDANDNPEIDVKLFFVANYDNEHYRWYHKSYLTL